MGDGVGLCRSRFNCHTCVMFEKKTTLVVGAGASREYDLPIGEGLKERIAASLKTIGQRSDDSLRVVHHDRGSDEVLVTAIERVGDPRRREWKGHAQMMWEGILQASSIDRYLHLHRADEMRVKIGKLAIARAILVAEQKSYLGQKKIDPLAIKEKVKGPNWLNELLMRLQEDTSLDRMEEMFSNLTIITFNYDRTIEHYLYHAIRDLTGLTPSQAAQIMSHLVIIHPYGKIGRLPWQPDDGTPALPYGHHERLEAADVIAAGDRLKTFTEAVDYETVTHSLHNAISQCDTLVFLGFAFLKQNIELLRPSDPSNVRRVEATRFGMSIPDRDLADARLRYMLDIDPDIKPDFKIGWRDLKAGQFLSEYGNSLIG